MGAPRGNRNAEKGKRWRDALDKALKEYEGPGIVRGSALKEIALRVVQQALEGNKDSIQEIAVRLDGKPSQEHVHSGDKDAPVEVNVNVRHRA